MGNVPEAVLAQGTVSAESVDEFTRFFQEIMDGAESGEAKLNLKLQGCEKRRWFDARFVSLFDSKGEMYASLISYLDITDAHEKELVHQHSIANTLPDKHTAAYMEVDLTSNRLEKYNGYLFEDEVNGDILPFD